MRTLPVIPLLVLIVIATNVGCVRRTVTITTEPAGALVWLNDREVGRTPLEVDFDFYGTYDVRLEREGYEPVMTFGRADAPWWDIVGLDLVSELVPADLHSRIAWHFELQPLDTDREALLGRARELRSKLADQPAPDIPDPPEADP